MDHDKAIRAAKLTLGGMLEKRRAAEAKQRAPGQIAPSKYLPGVPRAAHASGGYVPAASLPVARLAVAKPAVYGQQPTALDALSSLASIGETVKGFKDTIDGRNASPPQDSHAGRAEAGGGMSPEAVSAYTALLEAYGKPLTVVSDYRTPSENAAAKGAKGSQHMHGNAYDIDVAHLSPEERLALADQAWDAGFRGVGFYDNSMHFDVADPRAWGPSYSRDSIPEWAQPWAQQRYGYADGGEVTDLGQAREQKQLRTFHGGMMDDIHTRANHAMEAHQKAVDAGVFDGYELGDVLQGSAHPMRIKAKFMRQWKPTPMTLQSFDRMGTKPTIIEHEGKQYIPMVRYQTGMEGQDGFQEGDAYLDGIKAAGYKKMGGLRAVKAAGGAVTTKTKDGSGIFGNGAMIHRYTHPETGGYIDVLQRPQGPASVLGLEVPEEHRGKGIGQMLQAEALERHSALMGQVSSKAAATTAYRLGRRPYGAPDATLDDVFSTIDSDSSVNMLSPQAQPKADGGAATSDMFQGIHPDLQNEQGNPMDLYHGTPGEGFSEFKDEKLGSTRDHGFYGRGHYLTPDLEGASEYAGSHADEGTLMGPLHAALKNPYVWDASDNGAHRTLRDLQSMGIMKDKDKLEAWDNLQRHHIDPFMREMQKRGHDGVVVRTNDYSGDKPHRVSEIVVFKPTAIKHKDAAVFDPNDPNIYRANGGAIK
jgi:ribosomal protein S18 acetylase RimI-like enzyme